MAHAAAASGRLEQSPVAGIVTAEQDRLARFRADTAEARDGLWRDLCHELSRDQRRKASRDRLHAERNGWPLPIGGGAPSLPTTLAALHGALVANTFTGPQTIIGPDTRGPFSVDWFNGNGSQWEMEAMGIVGTTGTPTLSLRVASGVVVGTITTSLATTATITTISGLANVDWYLYVMGRTVLPSAAASTMIVTGFIQAQLATAAANNIINYLKNATPPTAVTVDLSSSVFLDLQATWSASSVSNTTTTNHYRLTSIWTG